MTLLLRRLALLGVTVLLTGCTSLSSDTAPAGRSSAATGSPSIGPPADRAPATYLALGDSVAAGVGAAAPATSGYVPVLAGLLADRLGCGSGRRPGCPLQVRNLAVAGATTTTLLRDQLPRALALAGTAADLRLVTVTVGGNDVFRPVVQACARSGVDPACPQAVRETLRRVDAGVDEVLRRLTSAVGPRTTVAVMAYYNPVPACRLAALQPVAERVLEGTAALPGLNDVLRTRAAQHGALVVETGDRLTPPGDFVGGLDCLHPSTSGHARIAEAFLDTVGGQVLSTSGRAPRTSRHLACGRRPG